MAGEKTGKAYEALIKILLLDGTWNQKDIETLTYAGWDEIFYPDEMDKLKAAIV